MSPRKLKKQKTWVSLLFLGASVILFRPVVEEVINTIQLKQSIQEVETQLLELEAQNSTLQDQKTKLEDPEYVKSYARATYMLTKEGEQIYYLPKEGK